jgi:hypothetical protein
MTLGQLVVLYLLAGAAIAVAVYLTTATRGFAERGFQLVTALLFWPLYLTLLLSRPGTESGPARAIRSAPPCDHLAAAIALVDAELEAALHSLDGWAEGVFAREKGRLDELRAAWAAQAQHVRDIDRLLARIGRSDDEPDDPAASDRVRASRIAVRQNTERLRTVRARSYQGLVETLAWVRELVSMIHLAKFTGAPASRAEELVGRIAAAVEGLSALTWQDEAPPFVTEDAEPLPIRLVQ